MVVSFCIAYFWNHTDNPLCLYFQISIMPLKTLSDAGKILLLPENDDSGEENEEELIPQGAAAGDND